MWNRFAIILTAALGVALSAQGQLDSTLGIKPIPTAIESRFGSLKPKFSIVAPNIAMPRLNNYVQPEPLKLDYKFSTLSDSLKTAPELSASAQVYPQESKFDFSGNPFSRDWSASGEVLKLSERVSLVGSGSRTTYPALGNIATGSLGFQLMPTGRLTVGMGVSGVKYHMGRSAWNDYGLYVEGAYQLTDRLSVNAFGQYYFNQRYHSVGAMGYMATGVYGGYFDYKFSDKFGLGLGAQRYYDAYTGRWRTVPIVAPTINLFGAPISVDVGGLLYNLVNGIIRGAREPKGGYSVPSKGAVPVANPASQFGSRRAQGGNIR